MIRLTDKKIFTAPWGTVEQTWQLNETFTQAPTNESEHAWDSIVPIGRGFITHPGIAPYISNIAVFHQLHCLVRSRLGLSLPLNPHRQLANASAYSTACLLLTTSSKLKWITCQIQPTSWKILSSTRIILMWMVII